MIKLMITIDQVIRIRQHFVVLGPRLLSSIWYTSIVLGFSSCGFSKTTPSRACWSIFALRFFDCIKQNFHTYFVMNHAGPLEVIPTYLLVAKVDTHKDTF